jgi:hypothetical protein
LLFFLSFNSSFRCQRHFFKLISEEILGPVFDTTKEVDIERLQRGRPITGFAKVEGRRAWRNHLFRNPALKALEQMFKSIEDGMKSFGRWISDAIESLMKQFRPPPGPQLGAFNPAAALRSLLFVLIVVLAALLLWLLIRIWRRRQPAVEVIAQSATAAPDVADENVGAEQLPEDGWMKLARELLERGELRLAVRAFYLATLAHLAERNLLTLAKFKSNRDYERELTRRGHALAELPGLFGQNVSVFERVWYGLHDVNQDTVASFARNVERMKSPG